MINMVMMAVSMMKNISSAVVKIVAINRCKYIISPLLFPEYYSSLSSKPLMYFMLVEEDPSPSASVDDLDVRQPIVPAIPLKRLRGDSHHLHDLLAIEQYPLVEAVFHATNQVDQFVSLVVWGLVNRLIDELVAILWDLHMCLLTKWSVYIPRRLKSRPHRGHWTLLPRRTYLGSSTPSGSRPLGVGASWNVSGSLVSIPSIASDILGFFTNHLQDGLEYCIGDSSNPDLGVLHVTSRARSG
jgi:hypothetical protein